MCKMFYIYFFNIQIVFVVKNLLLVAKSSGLRKKKIERFIEQIGLYLMI